jgi:hypothetical protein
MLDITRPNFPLLKHVATFRRSAKSTAWLVLSKLDAIRRDEERISQRQGDTLAYMDSMHCVYWPFTYHRKRTWSAITFEQDDRLKGDSRCIRRCERAPAADVGKLLGIDCDWGNIKKRFTKEIMAVAVAGTAIGAGCLILVLLFVLCWLFRKRLWRKLRLTRPSALTHAHDQRMRPSAMDIEKGPLDIVADIPEPYTQSARDGRPHEAA